MLSREKPSADPISRLEHCRNEIDRVFGDGFASAHPELCAAVMVSAAIDFGAVAIAHAVHGVGAALVDDVPDLVRRPAVLR